MKLEKYPRAIIDPLRWIAEVTRLQDINATRAAQLPSTYVKGRLRPERAAPSSSSDTIAGDQENDIWRGLSGGTWYEMQLINNAGTLQWRRAAYATF